MPARNYRDLIAWKKAFELTLAVYAETACFPTEEKFGIYSTTQEGVYLDTIKYCGGGGRKSASEFRRYLFIALGSLKEAETQILIADALGYFKPNKAAKLMALSAEVGRLINGLIKFTIDSLTAD